MKKYICLKCKNSSLKWIDDNTQLLGGYVKVLCLMDDCVETDKVSNCENFKEEVNQRAL